MTVAIIGGGVSGLALGEALARRQIEAHVFEAGARPGGKVASVERDGFVVEAGPNGFLDSEPAMRSLVERLELTPALRRASQAAKRRFLYSRGKLQELYASPRFFTSNLLTLRGRLRILGEPFSRRGSDEDESVASFMRRHLGSEATEVLVDAAQSGIYAGDPEQLSAGAAFPKLKELERAHRSFLMGALKSRKRSLGPTTLCSFEGGLQTLVDKLSSGLPGRVHCDARAVALEPHSGGWNIKLEEAGSLRAFRADRVVLGVPAYAAADLTRGFNAELSRELLEIPYAAVSVVHLGFQRKELTSSPEGFGALLPHREGRPTLGILFVSSFFPWRVPPDSVLLTVMLGGARGAEAASGTEAELAARARDDVARVLGIRTTPWMTQVMKWERAIPQYVVGHEARVARMEALAARHPGLFLGGNALHGVGLNDCVRNAEALAD